MGTNPYRPVTYAYTGCWRPLCNDGLAHLSRSCVSMILHQHILFTLRRDILYHYQQPSFFFDGPLHAYLLILSLQLSFLSQWWPIAFKVRSCSSNPIAFPQHARQPFILFPTAAQPFYSSPSKTLYSIHSSLIIQPHLNLPSSTTLTLV